MALTQVQGGMLAGSTNTTTTIQSNGTTAITIDSSQNVGIGKTPGTSILDIAGEGQTGSNNMYLTWSTTSSGYGATLNLRKSNGTKASPTAVANGDQIGVLVFAGYDGSNYQNAAYIESRVDGTPGTNDMPGRLVFFTTPDGSASPTERMRINSSGNMVFANRSGGGNVGQLQVGLTSVLGSINAYGQFGGDSGTPYPLGVKGNSSSQGMVGFFDSADSVIGSISKSGSNVAYNTSSDYRLKENIAPMIGALDKVAQLKPVTYTWKSDGSDGQGFIAHELQAVVPDAVTGEKDAVDEKGNIIPQGVDTSFLVATLTAAIQELKAELDATKAEVAALKATP